MQPRTRAFVLVPVFATVLGLGLAFGRAQQETKVERHAVAGAVSYLTGEGGNVGVSEGADGLLIVDDQFERMAPKLEAALGVKDKGAPRFLVNTHHHGDHTDGNKHFGKASLVVAHENVRARLLDEKAPPQSLPVVTYADGLSLHWNGEELRLIHVPGAHTDGDTVVWFTGSKVVHMGDLYFQLGYPYVDVGSGGNVFGLIAGIQKVLALVPPETRFIPGHGEATDRAGLEQYLAMLVAVSGRVKEHAAKGEDATAMVAAGVTRDYDERWGHFDFVPPKNFVQSVIDSL